MGFYGSLSTDQQPRSRLFSSKGVEHHLVGGRMCRSGGGIYIFAIIAVDTNSKVILNFDLIYLLFLSEAPFKIAIFADVARHGNISRMPREHLCAKFRSCPCLQLPSSTNMWGPHVSVIFNLKLEADAYRSGHRPISCARRPLPRFDAPSSSGRGCVGAERPAELVDNEQDPGAAERGAAMTSHMASKTRQSLISSTSTTSSAT
jgi:hypothetical protein